MEELTPNFQRLCLSTERSPLDLHQSPQSSVTATAEPVYMDPWVDLESAISAIPAYGPAVLQSILDEMLQHWGTTSPFKVRYNRVSLHTAFTRLETIAQNPSLGPTWNGIGIATWPMLNRVAINLPVLDGQSMDRLDLYMIMLNTASESMSLWQILQARLMILYGIELAAVLEREYGTYMEWMKLSWHEEIEIDVSEREGLNFSAT